VVRETKPGTFRAKNCTVVVSPASQAGQCAECAALFKLKKITRLIPIRDRLKTVQEALSCIAVAWKKDDIEHARVKILLQDRHDVNLDDDLNNPQPPTDVTPKDKLEALKKEQPRR
jgi:hypothetical protein